MKKKPIIIALIVVLGISLVFYGLTFVESREERSIKECLFNQPVKCGNVNMTEGEILEDIDALGLSKGKARKLFLKEQEENQFYLMRYSDKDERDLTSEERRMKTVHEDSVPYYERALQAVERMTDSRWLSP
ncbi:MAG: hypothetical protein WAU31_01170 [Candidatus Moraniibacteriota bacterium]